MHVLPASASDCILQTNSYGLVNRHIFRPIGRNFQPLSYIVLITFIDPLFSDQLSNWGQQQQPGFKLDCRPDGRRWAAEKPSVTAACDLMTPSQSNLELFL